LKPNEISEPFKTRYGWHIVQMLGTRTYDSTDDVRRQRAFAAIRESKADEETELWLRRLRDEAFVEIKMCSVRTAHRHHVGRARGHRSGCLRGPGAEPGTPISWSPAMPRCSNPRRARSALPLDIQPTIRTPARRASAGAHSRCCTCPPAQPVIAGQLDPRNAAYVIEMLDRACDGCMNGEFAAMVTAPVQKSTLMDAGYAFTGHTEYLAARTRAALPVMMLLSGELRVALVTTHLALADVPRPSPGAAARHAAHRAHGPGAAFRLAAPRIAVLGLNPHAGESGHLGREEIEVIEPAIRELRAEGIERARPGAGGHGLRPAVSRDADVIVAMYHDQGLPVIKHVGFGNAVNVTWGCPSCAPASITARRSRWRAPARPMSAACAPR
jgi:4-hydroxythreonine-4-phosphate dehydrogenase